MQHVLILCVATYIQTQNGTFCALMLVQKASPHYNEPLAITNLTLGSQGVRYSEGQLYNLFNEFSQIRENIKPQKFHGLQ